MSVIQREKILLPNNAFFDPTDQRLDDAIEKAKSEIAKNNWRMPQHEEQIVNKVVECVHEKFGHYNEEAKKSRDEIKKWRDLRNEADKDPKVTEKEKQRLEKGYEKAEAHNLEIASSVNAHKGAKTLKKGESMCMQLSGLTYVALIDVGVKGAELEGDEAQNVMEDGLIGGHAYIKLASQHICDPSTDRPFKKNINGGKNNVILTEDGYAYGWGVLDGNYINKWREANGKPAKPVDKDGNYTILVENAVERMNNFINDYGKTEDQSLAANNLPQAQRDNSRSV